MPAVDAAANPAPVATAAPAILPPAPSIPTPPLAGPLGDLPEGFWSWPANEQLKWLQTRQTVLDLVKKFFETQKDIRDVTRPAPMGGGSVVPVAASPVVVEPTKQGGGFSVSLPIVQRIYWRDGVAYADLLVGVQGVRAVRVGAPLPDGMRVAEITKEDVVVERDTHRIPLPGAAIPINQVLPAQPAIAPQPVQAAAVPATGGAATEARLRMEPGASPLIPGMR